MVRSAVDDEVYDALRKLRALVAHLDSHPACTNEPHPQQPLTLLRFLRARNFNLQQAAQQLTEALDWRAEFQIDDKLEAWQAEWEEGTSARVRFLRKYDFVKFCGLDRDGAPVYLHEMGQSDPPGITREIGEECLLLHFVRTFEVQRAAGRALFFETGRLPRGSVEIYDLGNYAGVKGMMVKRGFSMIPLYKGFARVFDKVYPERIRVAFLVRAPRLFDMIWRAIYPAIPDGTRRKCKLYGPRSACWLEEMGALLPPGTIPTWLRSDAEEDFAEGALLGGMVPRGSAAA